MARFVKFIGIVFISIAVLLFKVAIAIHKSNAGDLSDGPIYICSLILFITGLYLWRKGKRGIRSKPIDFDTTPFVLYLRPFQEDAKRIKTYAYFLLYPSAHINLTTQEENLARVVKSYGTLTAIGNPNDIIPVLGAQREYYKDSEWKEVIAHGLEKAQLIILRAGTSDGFLWELEQVMSTTVRNKSIILMPGKEEEYNKVAELVRKLSQIDLPKFTDPFFRSTEINCILYFNKNGVPRIYYPKLFYFQLIRFDPNAHALKKCLAVKQAEDIRLN